MRLRRLSGMSVPPKANTTRCPASWIELRDGSGGGGASASKLPQHVLEDPAVAEVQRLLGRVDPHPAGELLVARLDGDLARRALAVVDRLGDPGDGELLLAGQPERLGVLALGELQRQHAHADEVRAV